GGRRPLHQRSFCRTLYAACRGREDQKVVRECDCHFDSRGQRSRSAFCGDRPSRLVSQRMAGEILEPRARELFEMLRENLRHAGMLEVCAAGIVLSGGGSRLPGLMDIADSVLRKPVRMAWPSPIAKMPSSLAEPEFATVLGMV